ncbi:MAG: hypothetical protein G01um101466_305 [Parcubacteria group bacterium Gr01-1014_66]|nr:MAG: hypothetical protein G01um101466_305 [Parcubacteria group bacterium Gr01-1014_66]
MRIALIDGPEEWRKDEAEYLESEHYDVKALPFSREQIKQELLRGAPELGECDFILWSYHARDLCPLRDDKEKIIIVIHPDDDLCDVEKLRKDGYMMLPSAQVHPYFESQFEFLQRHERRIFSTHGMANS